MAFTGSLFEVTTLEYNLQRPLRIWHWGSLHPHPRVFCTAPSTSQPCFKHNDMLNVGYTQPNCPSLPFFFWTFSLLPLSTLLLIKIKLKYHFFQVLDITLSILVRSSPNPSFHGSWRALYSPHYTWYRLNIVSPPPQIHILKP